MADNIKIGLLCNFYGFPEYTDKVLENWKKIPEIYKVAVSSYQYKDYVEAGWNVDDVETPIKLLKEHRDFVDYICTGKEADDSFSRNIPLNHLMSFDIDYVWILDQDEFYSEDDIKNVIAYLDPAKNIQTYKINFKNFVFSRNQYIDDFNPPRIFATKIKGKRSLSHFYYENDVAYNIDNKMVKYSDLPMETIPKNLCFPDHHSWDGSPEFLKAKIKYQQKRYGGLCSYRWDSEKNSLAFNESFYKYTNQSIPKVKKV